MTMTQLLLMLLAAAIFGAVLTALAAFVVQLVILNLTGRRFRPLRWVTLTVPGLMLCCASLTESAIWLGAAGALFLGWVLAWVVYRLACGGDRLRDPRGEERQGTMKKQTRLYNVILPIWILIFFPQLLVFVIPGNLLVDCAVLFFTLLALKHTQKGAVMKQLWWKFWLLGFAADGVGVIWLLLGAFGSPYVLGDAFYDTMRYLYHDPFGHPSAFLWTLAGVAIAGACIYCFDKRAMRSCGLLTEREKHVTALAMAIATAPWLFFIPTYL